MIGVEQLAALRTGATVINTARGALLDHDALLTEVSTGRLSAVLDVTDPEPLPDDHPLWALPNVFITPHLAGSQGTELRRMTDHVVDEIDRWSSGRPRETRSLATSSPASPDRPARYVETMDEIDNARYIALTTFKRDGTPKATPVWISGRNGAYLFYTGVDAWKTKRLRNNSAVEVSRVRHARPGRAPRRRVLGHRRTARRRDIHRRSEKGDRRQVRMAGCPGERRRLDESTCRARQRSDRHPPHAHGARLNRLKAARLRAARPSRRRAP